MFELEPALATLRDALRAYHHHRHDDALRPALLAYGRAARHRGIPRDEAAAVLRSLFAETCAGEPAGARHRQRCARLVRTLERAYTRPTSDVGVARTA